MSVKHGWKHCPVGFGELSESMVGVWQLIFIFEFDANMRLYHPLKLEDIRNIALATTLRKESYQCHIDFP
jgi:hypothetical protein